MSDPISVTVESTQIGVTVGRQPPIPAISIAADGPQGPPGSTGAATVFEFTQTSPSTVWTIVHNLGRDPVGLAVYDSTGALREFPNVQQVDPNTTTVTFLTAISGKAVYS